MRTRILLIVGTTLAVMLATILLATRIILLRGYDAMERSSMGVNIDRVRNAMERDLVALGQTATDWASWDETYEFIRTLSPAYVETNLTVKSMRNLDVELAAFFDSTHGLVYHWSERPRPEDLATLLDRYPQLAGLPDAHGEAAGFVTLDGGPWLVVSRPIMDSDEVLAPRGRLLLGRHLDTSRAMQLSARVRLGIALHSAGEAVTPPDADEGLSPTVERPAIDRLRTYLTIRDLGGAPVAVLAIEAWSDFRRQALNSTYASIAAIIATGLIFGAGTLGFLERRVLARLHSLSAQVLAIKTGEKTAQRLEIQGTDQIAYLAAAINGMLAALETSTEELRQSERRTLAFLEAVPDLILLVSADGTIRDMRVPEGMGAVPDLRGHQVSTIHEALPWLTPNLRGQFESAVSRAASAQTPGFIETEIEIGGRRRWYEFRVSGSVSGETVVVARDVTAQRHAEVAEQKELLLRETHHRVRNNLQVISSLLALQANAAHDPETRAMLEESQDRVRSMALIHERLSHAERGGGLGFASYLRDLVEHLERSYGDAGRIRIDTELEDVGLPEDASLPAGLVVNELLTNALRHAYPDGRSGRVLVGLARTSEGGVVIQVDDDGIGLPEWVDAEDPASLGFRIVRALVNQLGATLTIQRGGGTRYRLLLSGPTPSV